jgi:hypothetical protein
VSKIGGKNSKRSSIRGDLLIPETSCSGSKVQSLFYLTSQIMSNIELIQHIESLPAGGTTLQNAYELEQALPQLGAAFQSAMDAAPETEAVDDLRAELQFVTEAALSEDFKAVLLEVHRRRRKENLQRGRVLGVEHPLITPEEERAGMVSQGPLPKIIVRNATPIDLSGGITLDDANVVRSSRHMQCSRHMPALFL